MLKLTLILVGIIALVGAMLAAAHHRGPKTTANSRSLRMWSAFAAVVTFAVVIVGLTKSVFFGMIVVLPLGTALAAAAGVYLTGQVAARAMELTKEMERAAEKADDCRRAAESSPTSSDQRGDVV